MDIIEQAREGQDYLLFEKFAEVVPTWQNFLDNMNESFNQTEHRSFPDYKEFEDPRMISESILIYNKLDPVVMGALRFEDTETFRISTNTMSMLSDIMGKKAGAVKNIMNFVSGDKYYVHRDTHDVIAWQCIGSVEWRLYKNIEDSELHTVNPEAEYESIVLKPGDAIFVPKGLAHQVVITEPRASIIFDY
jgi:ribosomal protein L16 Arg81 hydroxylase